jgi:hypothetical protein
VDRKRERATLDLTIVPRAGKQFAAFCKYLSRARSTFAPLADRAPVSLIVHLPPPPDLFKTLPGGDKFQEFARTFFAPRDRRVVQRLIDSVVKTLRTRGLDACVLAFPGRRLSGEPTMVIGLKVQEGRKLDLALRDSYRDLPSAFRKQFAVQWNLLRHGTARIHKFKYPGRFDLLVAFREDVLFLSETDKTSLKLLRHVLDKTGPVTPRATPALRLRAFPGKLIPKGDLRKAFHKVAPGVDLDKLRVELRLEGGDALHLRLEVSTHLLNFQGLGK